jgi:uncharacterized SAM-binding protein YcdF (DUF218 family)
MNQATCTLPVLYRLCRILAGAAFVKSLATEVWLTQGTLHSEDNEMIKLGIHVIPEHEYSRQVLERLGVPPDSIWVIDGRVDNTAQKVTVVAKEMRRVGGKRVVLITSKYHTRRVRVIWSKLVGNTPQAIVRYTPYDPYDPDPRGSPKTGHRGSLQNRPTINR